MNQHGLTGYRDALCRCTVCRSAHAAEMRDWQARKQALTGRHAHSYGNPWTPADDALALDAAAGTITHRAVLLGRTYTAVNARLRVLRTTKGPATNEP